MNEWSRCVKNEGGDLDYLAPQTVFGCSTLEELLERAVTLYGDDNFLGSRNNQKEGSPYEWKTFRQVYDIVDKIARGMGALNLAPYVEQEGSQWRFMGIFGGTREEWALTDLACMRQGVTIAPFYTNLSIDGLLFIINQT
jgi:long-subunit acyl-CoA synthetase (AMP-forming)